MSRLQGREFATALRALLDKIEAVKGPVVDMHRTLGRTAHEGRSVWIRASEVDLPAARECVNVNEFERPILESGGVGVEIAFEDVEFLDRPVPAESSCLLGDSHVWTSSFIVARPVVLKTLVLNRQYQLSVLSRTPVEITLAADG